MVKLRFCIYYLERWLRDKIFLKLKTVSARQFQGLQEACGPCMIGRPMYKLYLDNEFLKNML